LIQYSLIALLRAILEPLHGRLSIPWWIMMEKASEFHVLGMPSRFHRPIVVCASRWGGLRYDYRLEVHTGKWWSLQELRERGKHWPDPRCVFAPPLNPHR
jgi:hypothetical protein